MKLSDLDNLPEVQALYEVGSFPNIHWLKQLRTNCSTVVTSPVFQEFMPDEWLENLVPVIAENVDYISSSPLIATYKLDNDLKMMTLKIDKNEFFKTMEEVEELFKSFKYKGIILYLIKNNVKFDINKGTCESEYHVRYAEFDNTKKYRGIKLESILEE